MLRYVSWARSCGILDRSWWPFDPWKITHSDTRVYGAGVLHGLRKAQRASEQAENLHNYQFEGACFSQHSLSCRLGQPVTTYDNKFIGFPFQHRFIPPAETWSTPNHTFPIQLTSYLFSLWQARPLMSAVSSSVGRYLAREVGNPNCHFASHFWQVCQITWTTHTRGESMTLITNLVLVFYATGLSRPKTGLPWKKRILWANSLT